MALAGAPPPTPPLPPEPMEAAPLALLPRAPPPAVDEDSCKDTRDVTVTEERPCTQQELDNGQTNSSSLNSSSECENQTPNDGEMTEQESKLEAAKTEGDESSRDKLLKKPDKILPCPRCSSMDTKFCYYNNYNINQPRHFCKSCQRYWTAGGSMRNIPVGAGKRKSKSSSTNCRTILIPGSSLAAPGGDASLIPLSTKGNQQAVINGSDSPLCNSTALLPRVEEQSKNVNPASTAHPRSGENQACPPSVTASDNPRIEPVKGTVNGHQNGTAGDSSCVTPMNPMPCFPGHPAFMYPWNPAWNGIPAMVAPVCPAPAEPAHSLENGNGGNVQWNLPPIVPVPGFCGPPIPFPVMPPSVWPFISAWPNGAWSTPWLGPSYGMPPTSSSTFSESGSLVLGKHSRDTNPQGDEKTEKSLWIPKTLRIDDPDEAAKSSIWTTLGIEPGERGMFRPFQSKSDAREQVSGAAQVMHANPAAQSRFQTFQEST